MKLRSFGRIFSLIAILALAFALTFAVSVTANAAESEPDIKITHKLVDNDCTKVRFTWSKLAEAAEYNVYKDGVHIATVPNGNILRMAFNLEVDTEVIITVEALDAEDNTIAVKSYAYTPKHVPAEPVIENDVKPLCTVDGGYDTVVYCSICNVELTREHTVVPMLGHDLETIAPKDPTCTEVGWNEYVNCVREGCDYTTYHENELDPLGHLDDITLEAVEPTCTETGLTEGKQCSRCNEITLPQQIITAKGHKSDIILPAVDPTCTETGLTEGKQCSVCFVHTLPQYTIDALGHEEQTVAAQAPTCTEIGWEEYVICGRCDYTTYTELPANGHMAGAPVKENEIDPTCTKAGSYDAVVYCSVCGEELSRVKKTVTATGHKIGAAVKENEKKPTCTKAGSYNEVVYCTVCNAQLTKTAKTVPATGHTKAAGVSENILEATCTESGHYDVVVYCTTCGEELERESFVVEAFGHQYKEDTNPEAALVYEYCERCGGKGKFIKAQIPPAHKDTIIKVAIVAACVIVVFGCIIALAKPATTTPWWRRRR